MTRFLRQHKFHLKLLLIFVLFFEIISFLFPNQSFAQTEELTLENFETRIETTYDVDRNGDTFVSHNIVITNLTPTMYLKQYALKTSYFGLQNITVRQGDTQIPANIVSSEAGTSIGISFETDVVGQGKTRNFFIEYTNPDLATVAGNVLEIHIPKLGDDTSFDSNTTILKTPAFFSLPVRVTPEPDSSEFEQTVVTTKFNRPNGESISAIFGTSQNYKLTLRYHLENPSSNPALAQISLPPDTQYQKMHYHSLDPLPEEIKKDIDGNWIATYRLPASSVTVVHLLAEARVTLEANQEVPITQPLREHLESQEYWEVSSPLIQQKAQMYQNAHSIYDHVVDSLTYSRELLTLDTIERYGAVTAFANPDQAVCQEFTDSFIAISRAANIPARRLIGYAYTENSVLRPLSFAGDILHAWPEYYDYSQNKWIQIDPTWGNTTGGIDYFSQFDLNHIVFAINGTSSKHPNPAGSYKLSDETETKDVSVEIIETPFPEISPSISTRMEQKKFFFIPIPGMFTMYVTNNTGQAWYNLEPNIQSLDPSVIVSLTQESNSQHLLPFETKQVAVTFFTNQLSIPKESRINVNYRNTNTGTTLYEPAEQTIISGPKAVTYFQRQETYLYLGVGSVIIALITGSVLVYRQKRSRYIRR